MEDITVEFLGQEPVRARLIGFQPGADLALLQLDTVPPSPPVATVIADSSAMGVGDPVFIIGAPYGLTYSLSSGIVSARWSPNSVNREFPLAEFFQTDATINTGNSGGPMFNMKGEMIGIVSHMISKSGGSEGLGFVVTANTVRRLLFEKRPFYLGIDGQIVSGSTAQLLNVPQAGGYLVKTVVKNSLAEHLGLAGGERSATLDGQQIVLGGDIILAAQGIEIHTIDDLIAAARAIRDRPPGREVRMRVLRGGKVVDLTTTWAGGSPEGGVAKP
jgi:S1-C subfamily serine protease